MKLETHCHTFNSSSCADTENQIIIDKYLKAGYGGIVATNHFSTHVYKNNLQGQSHKEKVDSFFKYIDEFCALAKKASLKAFWGVEVRAVDSCNSSGTEYMIYGLDRKYFYDNKPLCALTQQELFALCEKAGAFMYQTHPFRATVLSGDPKFMHGAEAFNGHYHHPNNNNKAEDFCAVNGLIKMSGTDYHHIDQPITAGIIVPDTVTDEKGLINTIFTKNYTLIEDKKGYLENYDRYIKSRQK